MSAVLIIGASRGIGLETVKLALKSGHSVRALARSATAIPLHDLENVDGDALDQHTSERALVGVDAVIQTLGVSPTPELILGGTRLFSVATRILVNEQEWIIRRSSLDWTIARPTVLTTGPRTGAYRVLVDARDWRSGFISRAEVADFLVRQIEDASLLRKTPVLTG